MLSINSVVLRCNVGFGFLHLFRVLLWRIVATSGVGLLLLSRNGIALLSLLLSLFLPDLLFQLPTHFLPVLVPGFPITMLVDGPVLGGPSLVLPIGLSPALQCEPEEVEEENKKQRK